MVELPAKEQAKEKGFPSEDFVKESIKKYFEKQGFNEFHTIKYLDLQLRKGNQEWRIECKGETANVTVDFNTLLGQIIKRLDYPKIFYGIGLPYTSKYANQIATIPQYARKILPLKIFLVSEKGKVMEETLMERN